SSQAKADVQVWAVEAATEALGCILAAVHRVEEEVGAVAEIDLCIAVLCRGADIAPHVRDRDATRTVDVCRCAVDADTPVECDAALIFRNRALNVHTLPAEKNGGIDTPIDRNLPLVFVAPDRLARIPGDFGTYAVEATLLQGRSVINVTIFESARKRFKRRREKVIGIGIEFGTKARAELRHPYACADGALPFLAEQTEADILAEREIDHRMGFVHAGLRIDELRIGRGKRTDAVRTEVRLKELTRHGCWNTESVREERRQDRLIGRFHGQALVQIVFAR